MLAPNQTATADGLQPPLIRAVKCKESMKPTEVYLDTNIYKFSATQLPRLRPRQQTITWGDIVQEVTVHDFIEVDPNEKIQNQELRNEAELLPKVAELGEKVRLDIAFKSKPYWKAGESQTWTAEPANFMGLPLSKSRHQ